MRERFDSTPAEIDIIQVLAQTFYGIKKNIRIIAFCSFIGIFGGYCAYLLLSPTYKVNMLADSRILSSVEVNAIVTSWQDLINKGEYIALAEKLKLSPAIVKELSRIEAETSKKGVTTEDNKDTFIITVETASNNNLDTLQNAIVYYLENNEYTKRRIDIERENLSTMKKKVKSEITSLDSVKFSIQKLLKSGGTSTNAFLTDPGNVNLQIINLFEKILSIEEAEKLLSDIHVIEGFTKFGKPDSPKLSLCLIGGWLFGIFVSAIIIFYKIITERIKKLPA